MTDPQKLEKITEDFIKSVLANSFTDKAYYADLAERLAVIINFEIQNNVNHDKVREEIMKFWPVGSLN